MWTKQKKQNDRFAKNWVLLFDEGMLFFPKFAMTLGRSAKRQKRVLYNFTFCEIIATLLNNKQFT